MKLPRSFHGLVLLSLVACTTPEEAPERAPFRDANNNGVEDAKDIGNGTSLDVNQNGIPDEVEPSRADGE